MACKIAIIGAGPGGLCLANILQRNNIPFTVFEGDKAPHERNQGGTLDLHPQHGQLAMKEAGLWDEFCEHSRPEADVMKIIKTDGRVLWDGNGPDKLEKPAELRRPEIDREKLKDILFQNLEPANLKFGMHLKEVVPSESSPGKYDLQFKEESAATQTGFDLVVGADGAWSKVRKLVTDTLPHYSGISTLELWKSNVDETSPWLSQYIGAGSCFCFAEGRAVMMQKLGDGSARTYACLRQPETFLQDCGIDFTQPEEAHKQWIERYYGDMDAGIRRAMLESDSAIVPRALYMLPVGFQWENRPGITLLGDAAHVMTPFAGVGVNAALADAVALARCIVEAGTGTNSGEPETLYAAVREYEAEMFPRAEMFAKKTYEGLIGHFDEFGADEFAKRHRDMVAAMKK